MFLCCQFGWFRPVVNSWLLKMFLFFILCVVVSSLWLVTKMNCSIKGWYCPLFSRVGWCLPNWHRMMSTVKHRDGRWHQGAGLGVCLKRESVCRKARKTNNVFYGATKRTLAAKLAVASYITALERYLPHTQSKERRQIGQWRMICRYWVPLKNI